jgi:hypothetical protein
MADNGFQVPGGVRNVGIIGGLVMMALGLIIGWQRSGQSAALDQTGYTQPPKPKGILDTLGEALLEWTKGKKT